MKQNRRLTDFFPNAVIDPDVFPVVPIVELANDHRVLVENHLGVTQYSGEVIGVKMKYGELQICGCNLNLEQMTRIKLVITGRIERLTIIRRNDH